MSADLMDDLPDVDTAPTRPRWGRRTVAVVAVAAVLGVAGALGSAAVLRADDGDGTVGGPTRTVAATVRDLTALGSATGTVQRRTALTVVAGRTAPGEVATTQGSGTAGDGGVTSTTASDAVPAAASGSAQAAGTDRAAAVEPVALRVPGAAPSPQPSVSPTSTPTVSPSPTPSPTASGTPTPSASPTPTPSPSQTPTPTPTTSPTPTARPSPTPQPSPTAPLAPPRSPTGTTPPSATPPSGAGPAQPSPPAGTSTTPGQTTPGPAPLLTEVAGVGTTLDDGVVAYRVDGEAVVVMVDDHPSYRDLSVGASGPDVLALERLLQRLGRADGITVDDEYTTATASAVRRWERSLRRADPDGTVARGDLLVVAEPWQVTGTRAGVGAEAPDGTPVLTLGSGLSEVVVDVDVDDLGSWRTGTAASVTIGSEQVDGVVESVGRDAVDDRVEVRISVGRSPALPGTRADATVTVADRSRVVAVPVSSVVAGSDGTAVVRRVTGTGPAATTTEVPVTLGLTVDGWAEVTGIRAGDRVVVP